VPDHKPNEHGKDQSQPTLGSVLTSEGFSIQDREFESVADQALKDRPTFSIRTRLILAFSLFFLLSLAITIWVISFLADVHDKILFLEVADDYKVEIQQARRFEKNFLLYGTNLDDAREHARSAQRLTAENTDMFRKVVGDQVLKTMNLHLEKYMRLLDALGSGDNPIYEGKLRDHGTKMLKLAQDFVVKERKLVHTMLSLTRKVPLIFLGVLFVLGVGLVAFLARQIIGNLSRFLGYTERIATGDFTPITPTRKYRDEFSKLALWINRMVRALDRQHRILVESHKLRAMGTLVAGVAHELNNPMNNILLTASVLQDEYDSLEDEEKTEMIGDVIDQAERSKRIVANLLDFARESETKVEALHIRTLLDETAQLVGNQIRLKKVQMIIDLPEDVPPVHGDRQLLSQAFMNLILNALEALPEKGTIHIGAGSEWREGFLAVDVSDNGPGMPGHILSRIFDPFFTTKPKGRGTGLGLSVSRGIIRKLGGYLLVKSQLGKGTTFTVELPITTIPSEVSSKGASSTPPGDREAK
jgi:signal transduction histidine kinase